MCQVRAMGVEEGEERHLRAQLRQMESRRSAVERCGLVRTALGSEVRVALLNKKILFGSVARKLCTA